MQISKNCQRLLKSEDRGNPDPLLLPLYMTTHDRNSQSLIRILFLAAGILITCTAKAQWANSWQSLELKGPVKKLVEICKPYQKGERVDTTTYFFDRQGRVTKKIEYSIALDANLITIHTYTANTETEVKKYPGAESRTVYYYDNAGKKTREDIYDYNKRSKTYIWLYNDRGYLREQSDTSWNNDGSIETSRTVYALDNAGNITEERLYFNDQLSVAQFTTYNSKGQKISLKAENEKGANAETATYEYDNNGRLTQIHKDMNMFIKEHYEITRTYDAKGNLLCNRALLTISGRHVIDTYSKYDKYGNWLTHEYDTNLIGSDITTRKIEYY